MMSSVMFSPQQKREHSRIPFNAQYGTFTASPEGKQSMSGSRAVFIRRWSKFAPVESTKSSKCSTQLEGQYRHSLRISGRAQTVTPTGLRTDFHQHVSTTVSMVACWSLTLNHRCDATLSRISCADTFDIWNSNYISLLPKQLHHH